MVIKYQTSLGDGWRSGNNGTSNVNDLNSTDPSTTYWLPQDYKIPLLVFSSFFLLLTLAKMLQDRAYLYNLNHLRHRTEDLINIIVFALIVTDQFKWEDETHRQRFLNCFNLLNALNESYVRLGWVGLWLSEPYLAF